MTLAIGDSVQVQGSGAKPYVVKNVDGTIWSCTCLSWKNSGGQINTKSCKHIRLVHGAAEEAARIGQAGPSTVATMPDHAVSPRSSGSRAAENLAAGKKLRQDEKVKLYGPPLLLAETWDGDQDPTGWFMSEKLDGVRTLYRDGRFISRQGNEYMAPDFFKAGLGDDVLDGELFLARSEFAKTISVVKSQGSGEAWRQITFRVFDAPESPGTFEERIEHCKRDLVNASHASVLEQTLCEGASHLKEELKRIESLGGEGVMLRKPGSRYEIGRSGTLLKVKSFFDSEAEVVGHVPGRGKFKGMLGALRMRVVADVTLKVGGKSCVLKAGTEFEVGTGLLDSHRRSPPAPGSIITFSFQELSKDGIPRFPVFTAIRDYE